MAEFELAERRLLLERMELTRCNVVDADADVSQRELGGHHLPHVNQCSFAGIIRKLELWVNTRRVFRPAPNVRDSGRAS